MPDSERGSAARQADPLANTKSAAMKKRNISFPQVLNNFWFYQSSFSGVTSFLESGLIH